MHTFTLIKHTLGHLLAVLPLVVVVLVLKTMAICPHLLLKQEVVVPEEVVTTPTTTIIMLLSHSHKLRISSPLVHLLLPLNRLSLST